MHAKRAAVLPEGLRFSIVGAGPPLKDRKPHSRCFGSVKLCCMLFLGSRPMTGLGA